MPSKKIKCVKFIDDLKYVRKIKVGLKKYLPKDLIAIVLLGCTDPAEIAHRSAMKCIRDIPTAARFMMRGYTGCLKRVCEIVNTQNVTIMGQIFPLWMHESALHNDAFISIKM